MSIESIPGASFSYYLIAYDADGRERTDDPDGLMSERAAQAVRAGDVTDVFIVSHGWKGDLPAARDQYERWIRAMLACEPDRQRIRQARPRFAPLVIGFHWPSLPFGDEELGRAGVTFGGPAGPQAAALDDLVEAYAQRLVDTPAARAALRTVIGAALTSSAPAALPAEVRDAYVTLDRELALGAAGPAAPPGADREPFDPDRAYRTRGTFVPTTFGGTSLGEGLLGPLRQLSFWSMKDRGRRIAERAGARLLRSLQDAGAGDVHFHLIGHSFGCIVVSSMLRGMDGDAAPPRPVHSVALVQGALSLWSYCSDIPDAGGQAGYFSSLVTGGKVRGALITTQSRYDTAVGKLYPAAAGVAGQVTFAPNTFPKYGAVGAFGAQGPGLVVKGVPLRKRDETYGFTPGGVYNLESSAYICEGGGLSGAHSDIARAEVAHAVWEAAMTAP